MLLLISSYIMANNSIRTRKDVAKDLSQNLGTEVAPAQHADAELGDTLIYANNNGEIEAYVADGSVQRPAIGEVDYVENWGTFVDDSGSASANQYKDEIPDNVGVMLESDIAAMDTEIQRRDETTNVSHEYEAPSPGQGFIDRALEEGTHGLRSD